MNWLLGSESVIRILIAAAGESAVLVLIVYLLLWLIGRWISPSWRVALWTIPLVRLVVLVLPVVSLSLFPTREIASLASTEPRPTPPSLATDTSYPLPVPLLRTSDHTKDSLSVKLTQWQTRISHARLFQLAWIVWLGGVAVCGARWLLMSIALRRVLNRSENLRDTELRFLVDEARRRANLARPVQCIVTDEEFGPATYGLFRPKIVLSKRLANELTRSEFEMVVAHEVEHIRRCDCLLMAIGRLAVTLHWYNPVAYYVRQTLQREMELAVDAATIGKLGTKRIGDYGDLLIRLVRRPTSSLCAVPMARSGKGLHRRIESIVGWRRIHWSQQVLGAIAACLLTLFGLCKYDSTPAIAQEKSGPQPVPVAQDPNPSSDDEKQSGHVVSEQGIANELDGRSASGRVLDSAGNAVSSAQLFAEVDADDKTLRRVSATTNENGEFSMSYPASSHEYESYRTWAYAKGHGIRVVNMNGPLVGGKADDLEIRLPPLESREIKLILPDGTPCTNAVVVPRYIDVPNGVFEADEPTGLVNFLPELMKPLLAGKTDSQGRVQIEGIPLALLDSIEVESPKYGRQHFQRLGGENSEPLRLVEAGSINGSLKVQSPNKYAGIRVSVTTGLEGALEGIAETELDENGHFQIPAIAAGSVSLHLMWDLDTEVHPFIPNRAIVQAGEALDLEIQVRPTIPVTGTILTADTQEPVVRARLSLRHMDQGHVRILNHVETDEHGRYSTRLPTGKIARQVFGGVRSPYEYPKLESVVIPPEFKAYEMPEILIHPMRLVKGKLVGGTDKPISGATVVVHTGSYRHVAGQATTNDDGSFEMYVRNWNFRFGSSYWAILDQPAVKAEPPHYTRLEVLNGNPDELLLRHSAD